jgi:hypothetical protein
MRSELLEVNTTSFNLFDKEVRCFP